MRTRPSRARPSAELREQLECFATRQAAECLTDADAEGFARDHAEALRHLAAGRHRQAYDASVRLHGRIIALARNGRLTQFMSQLGDQVHRFGLMTLRHGRAARALEDHGAIIGALLARDGPAAEALMRAHLRDDREMTLRIALPAGFTAVETAA
jgi:DNA-binding GntR family transcriptional regulator